MTNFFKKAAFIAFAASAAFSTAVFADDDDGYPGKSPNICNDHQNLKSGCELVCSATPDRPECTNASQS